MSHLGAIKVWWSILRSNKWSISMSVGAALGGFGDVVCQLYEK